VTDLKLALPYDAEDNDDVVSGAGDVTNRRLPRPYEGDVKEVLLLVPEGLANGAGAGAGAGAEGFSVVAGEG
jgi:hypothetical protein